MEQTFTPRQVFEETQQLLLAHDIEKYIDFFGENAVIETKFTAAGQPYKIEGKAAIATILRASNQASPLKRKAFENTVVHGTDDPNVIIAEYDQISESKNGSLYTWSDVLILTVRDGKIQSVRAYSNPIAIAKAMQTVDKLIESLQ
ncbi:MAG TPA: nuclear transport factor 2 family protein [Candidatus Saccharimonadales bacterium]|nr:nuclear transport factor 2 family protein [Candidatus Saccharimonadales bacterium]